MGNMGKEGDVCTFCPINTTPKNRVSSIVGNTEKYRQQYLAIGMWNFKPEIELQIFLFHMNFG